MSHHDASAAAKTRTRKSGRFAEEARSAPESGLGDAQAAVGDWYAEASPAIGDVVRRRDDSDSDQSPQVVVELATYGSAGIESGYMLENATTGELTQTDLREDDWALVSQAPAVGEPNPYSGSRVMGDAEVGEIVHYYDISNQNRNPQRVLAPSQKHPKYGWESGYTLQDVVTGEHTTSDFRQHGWTFVEAPADTQP
jgi:hypothetical protein